MAGCVCVERGVCCPLCLSWEGDGCSKAESPQKSPPPPQSPPCLLPREDWASVTTDGSDRPQADNSCLQLPLPEGASREEGRGSVHVGKSFKAIVKSRGDTGATPDCTHFSGDPLKAKSAGTCGELTESRLNPWRRGSPWREGRAWAAGLDAEMWDLEPACLMDRGGAVRGAGAQRLGPGRRRGAPGKEVSDKNTDRQTDRKMDGSPSLSDTPTSARADRWAFPLAF